MALSTRIIFKYISMKENPLECLEACSAAVLIDSLKAKVVADPFKGSYLRISKPMNARGNGSAEAKDPLPYLKIQDLKAALIARLAGLGRMELDKLFIDLRNIPYETSGLVGQEHFLILADLIRAIGIQSGKNSANGAGAAVDTKGTKDQVAGVLA